MQKKRNAHKVNAKQSTKTTTPQRDGNKCNECKSTKRNVQTWKEMKAEKPKRSRKLKKQRKREWVHRTETKRTSMTKWKEVPLLQINVKKSLPLSCRSETVKQFQNKHICQVGSVQGTWSQAASPKELYEHYSKIIDVEHSRLHVPRTDESIQHKQQKTMERRRKHERKPTTQVRKDTNQIQPKDLTRALLTKTRK